MKGIFRGGTKKPRGLQPRGFGDGGNRTPVRVRNPCASTSVVMRGICREEVAASQASLPYSSRLSRAAAEKAAHQVPVSNRASRRSEQRGRGSGSNRFTRQERTVRFQTLRLLYVSQLFFSSVQGTFTPTRSTRIPASVETGAPPEQRCKASAIQNIPPSDEKVKYSSK